LSSLGVRRLSYVYFSHFNSFGHAVSEEKDLKKSANQKQELPVVAMFGNRS
jgi:predicted GIY-YIG superfamily endonuclease